MNPADAFAVLWAMISRSSYSRSLSHKLCLHMYDNERDTRRPLTETLQINVTQKWETRVPFNQLCQMRYNMHTDFLEQKVSFQETQDAQGHHFILVPVRCHRNACSVTNTHMTAHSRQGNGTQTANHEANKAACVSLEH